VERAIGGEGEGAGRSASGLAWLALALCWCALLLRFYRAFVSEDAWGLSDDVYISASAARSLLEGYGPVWYPDAPRVEGFSNPLWVAVLAALQALPGFDDDRLGGFVLGVDVLLFIGLAGACVRLLGAAGLRAWWLPVLLAPGLLALPCFAAEGFEVVAVALLAVLALDAAWREQPVRFAVWAALGFWTRMDFAVLAVLPGLALLWRARRDARLPWAIGLGAVLVGLLFALRLAYFGTWLPNPAYLKTTGWPLGERLARGFDQNAWAWPSALVVLGFAGLVRYAAPPRERERARLALGCVGIFVLALLYSTWVGGDFLGRRAGWDRFTAPALPVLSIGLALATDVLRASRALRAATAGLLLLALLAPAAATPPDRRFLDRRLLNLTIDAEPQRWSRGLRSLGLAYRDASLPGARMAVCAAGAIVYFSHRGGVDLLGKVDPVIARLPVTGPADERRCWRDWPGHNKEDVVGSFERHRPDFSAVPPPRALRDAYRVVRHEGHTFWVRQDSPYVRWDRLSPGGGRS
jgi:hypothetical protein